MINLALTCGSVHAFPIAADLTLCRGESATVRFLKSSETMKVSYCDHGLKAEVFKCEGRWLVPEADGTGDYWVRVTVSGGTEASVLKVALATGEFQQWIRVAVIPVMLHRPMPWGLYVYEWQNPKEESAWHLRRLKEMRAIGMTEAAISPCHMSNRVSVAPDGTPDLSYWDDCLALYRRAGFPDPPILAMEGLMYSVFAERGEEGLLPFSELLRPNIPVDVAALNAKSPGTVPAVKRALRGIYDHSLEAKWPRFYAYFADEPLIGTDSYNVAQFMFPLAREVAPELQICSGFYTLQTWRAFHDEADLVLAHYVHPCNNSDSNRRWLTQERTEHTKLFGVEFFWNNLSYWDCRYCTLAAIRGKLGGMMSWSQVTLGRRPEGDLAAFDPANTTGGPWVLADGDRTIYSQQWFGIEDGITDSKLVNTVRAIIEVLPPEKRSEETVALERLIDTIPWVPDWRQELCPHQAIAASFRDGLHGMILKLIAH